MTAEPGLALATIPDAALEDRLGVTGMTGSGKTYAAGVLAEKLLHRKGRVIIPDALGVWWGLRQSRDGKQPSGFDVVIFGGKHGDIPITPHSGALIGETAAGMRESAIVDLSELGSGAAERRFMLAFLSAVYRRQSREPVHIIFDEADLWAPQRIMDKEGEATKLHGMMQNVVRRGRVKGLTSWLITQRPAELSKSVLSQVDGLVAFKLVSAQDRKALGEWIKGQQQSAEQGNAILGSLPAKERGEALVWLPARGILGNMVFPEKVTYDSSRSPKRGEKLQAIELKPLDLQDLRKKLASVEEEAKSSSLPALKAENAKLKRELAAKPKTAPAAPNAKALQEAERRGIERGREEANEALAVMLATGITLEERVCELAGELTSSARSYVEAMKIAGRSNRARPPLPASRDDAKSVPARNLPPRPQSPPPAAPASVEGVTPAWLRIIVALRKLEAIGKPVASKLQVALFVGVSSKSSGYQNNLGAMRSAGLIEYPSGGMVALTEAGKELAPVQMPMDHEELMQQVRQLISPAQFRIVACLAELYPDPCSKEEIANTIGVSANSSGYQNNLGSLRSLGLIEYPGPGLARATEALFP